jgi:hypothetical protein
MASLVAQAYISPPDFDTVQFPSKKEILLAQQSAVNECERFQQSNNNKQRLVKKYRRSKSMLAA